MPSKKRLREDECGLLQNRQEQLEESTKQDPAEASATEKTDKNKEPSIEQAGGQARLEDCDQMDDAGFEQEIADAGWVGKKEPGLSRNKKIAWAGAVGAAAFSLIAGSALLFAGGGQKPPVVKQEVFAYEYGDKISLKPAAYLKEGQAQIECPSLARKYGWEADSAGNLKVAADGKVEPGEYDFFASNEGGAAAFVVKVEDTIAPVWDKKESALTFNEGELKALDLSKYFSAKDLSEVTIKADGDYSLSASGKYSLSVYAEDAYGNRTDAQTLVLTIKHVDTEKDKEVADKLSSYDDLVEEVDRLRTSLEDSTSKIGKLEKEVDRSAQEITTLRKDLSDSEKKLQQSIKQYNELQIRYDRLSASVPSAPIAPQSPADSAPDVSLSGDAADGGME